MKHFFTKILIKGLYLVNVYPTIMTNKEEILSLIRSLYPIKIDKEMIRLGSSGDGGYLVPNDFFNIKACFSPGVCEVSSFEKDCADMGMEVFMADKSVEGPACEHESFTFTQKYIGAVSNDDFMTIDEWVNKEDGKNQGDLLLQIDIEGFEYEVFLAMTDELIKRFRIIVVEFHNLDQLWNKPFFLLASSAFKKILQTHSCVHIHPNNSNEPLTYRGVTIQQTMEFTFIRHDRVNQLGFVTDFPNPLDSDCSDRKHIPLSNSWYSQK